MKTTDDIKLYDLIPDSLKADEKVQALCVAFDKQMQEISRHVDDPSIYLKFDELSSTVLDHLAVQYDVATWNQSWNVALKRSILRNAISAKRKQGTLAAVKEALKSIGASSSVTEWWQTTPKGKPHTFEINVTTSRVEDVPDAEMQNYLISLIDNAKPARSHYDFIIRSATNGTLGMFGLVHRPLTFKIFRTNYSSASIEYAIGSFGMKAVCRPMKKRHLTANT